MPADKAKNANGGGLDPADDHRWLALGARIGVVVDDLGMDKCVHATGKSAKQIKRYENGSEPPLGVVIDLCALSGASIDWIVLGNPVTSRDYVFNAYVLEDRINMVRSSMKLAETVVELEKLKEMELRLQKLMTFNREATVINERLEEAKMDRPSVPTSRLVRIARPAPPDEDSLPVQKLSIRASAGAGTFPDGGENELVRLPRYILERVGVAKENLRLLLSRGMSMWPTIGDGDPMLADIGEGTRSNIVDGCIYVFTIGDAVFVKRLIRGPLGWLMRSDNRELFPADEPVPPEAPFVVWGRIRWAGRVL